MARAGEHRPVEERYFDKVEMIPLAGCWIWMGGRVFRMGNKDAACIEPGRAAFEILFGETFDLHVLNVCGTCGCVNPGHSRLVTRSEKHAAQVTRINQNKTPEQRRQQASKAGRVSASKMTRDQLAEKMRGMRARQITRRD